MIYYIYIEQEYNSLLPLNVKDIFFKCPFCGCKDEKWYHKSEKHEISPESFVT